MTARGDARRDERRRVAVGVIGGLLSLVGIGALALRRRHGAGEAEAPARRGYETRDAPPRMVAAAIAGLLSLVGIGAVVAWAIAVSAPGRPSARPTGFDQAAAVPAAPRLAVDQTADRVRLERQAEAHLTGYGWTNQAAGLARIPIARAMALQASAGWPDAATNTAALGASNAAAAEGPSAAQPAPANAPRAAANVTEFQP